MVYAARPGMARLGKAGRGMAWFTWQGMAGRGAAGHGMARHGLQGSIGGIRMSRNEAIDALVSAVKKCDYGYVLSFDEIGGIINQRYGSAKYTDILQAARKQLIATGHMIVNVRGIGYKVCYPDDYTMESIRCMRQGARRIDRGTKILNYAPVSNMSQPAREAYNRVNDRMLRLQAAIAGASVEIHMLETNNKHPLLSKK